VAACAPRSSATLPSPLARVEADARRLVPSLRGAALLTVARGRPRVELAAAAEEAAALAWLGATYRDVDELEINPFWSLEPARWPSTPA
jgi:hypothetical protein